jgi:hypothetical protein
MLAPKLGLLGIAAALLVVVEGLATDPVDLLFAAAGLLILSMDPSNGGCISPSLRVAAPLTSNTSLKLFRNMSACKEA